MLDNSATFTYNRLVTKSIGVITIRRCRLVRSRAHDWKSCNCYKQFESSNLSISAKKRQIPIGICRFQFNPPFRVGGLNFTFHSFFETCLFLSYKQTFKLPFNYVPQTGRRLRYYYIVRKWQLVQHGNGYIFKHCGSGYFIGLCKYGVFGYIQFRNSQ